MTADEINERDRRTWNDNEWAHTLALVTRNLEWEPAPMPADWEAGERW